MNSDKQGTSAAPWLLGAIGCVMVAAIGVIGVAFAFFFIARAEVDPPYVEPPIPEAFEEAIEEPAEMEQALQEAIEIGQPTHEPGGEPLANEVTEDEIRGRLNFGDGEGIGGEGIGSRAVFDQSQVVRRIRARSRAFRGCYEAALFEEPTLEGRVTVVFTVQPSGEVSGARASSNTTGSGSLAECIVAEIAALRWDEGPEGGSVSFSYPFVFAPQD